MTTASPAAEHASARAFNDYHPVGTPVRYWKGAREGDGKVSRTRTQAQLLSGHTAVVWLEGVSGCIALTHIQPISEEELAAADRIPAPRPVPIFADRTAALEELREERVKTGRLEGDIRSQTRAVRELKVDLERADAQVKALAGTADTLHAELAAARQTAAFRAGVIARHRAELTAAGTHIATLRDLDEQRDRAWAAYDTTPGEEPEVDPDEDQAALEKLIATAHEDFAIATTPAERVEVIRDLLDGWYAAWPDTAVTDPHEPIAWELSSLVAPALGSPHRAQEEPAESLDPMGDGWTQGDGFHAAQRDRDRAERAIRDRLSAAWPQFDDRVFLDQVAVEAAVAAVEELARPAEARP